jgi:hypothetical protein
MTLISDFLPPQRIFLKSYEVRAKEQQKREVGKIKFSTRFECDFKSSPLGSSVFFQCLKFRLILIRKESRLLIFQVQKLKKTKYTGLQFSTRFECDLSFFHSFRVCFSSYCSLCGKLLFASSLPLSALKKRKEDGTYALDEKKINHKL